MTTQAMKSSDHTRSVTDYIKHVDPAFSNDAKTLVHLFTEVTGTTPKMWGASIVGFGEYHYKYASGREGDFLATGFSIRKSGPTIYIMPGYHDYSELLKNIGPHKLGKSCLYLKSLAGINRKALETLIKAGLRDLKKDHVVTMQ